MKHEITERRRLALLDFALTVIEEQPMLPCRLRQLMEVGVVSRFGTPTSSAILKVPALGSDPSFPGTRPGSNSSQMVVAGIGTDRTGC